MARVAAPQDRRSLPKRDRVVIVHAGLASGWTSDEPRLAIASGGASRHGTARIQGVSMRDFLIVTRLKAAVQSSMTALGRQKRARGARGLFDLERPCRLCNPDE
jgi:hypothetical protein